MSESPSVYDAIARVYDPWSAGVVEDVEFYVDEARASGGPVVEIACGTGRISVPVAKAGIRVIGVTAQWYSPAQRWLETLARAGGSG